MPGVTVTAKNTETGVTREAFTNESGNYSIPALSVGTWDLSAALDGFKTSVVSGIGLNVADVREINLELELGAINEEITTTAASAPIETISGEVAGLITGEQIRELPLNGRNFTQLTQLMPGVSAVDGIDFKNKGLLSGVDLSVSGSSVTGNNWTVDGAANNDTGSNRTILVTPSVDAIEEFKIHRNSYGPEFGGAGGAQINLVTRGGTNNFQGSAYAFFRNDSLNEKNFFLDQAGLPKEPLDRKDFGFTLGGPIAKDKVHFFISGEWNDEERGTVRSATVPTAAERTGDFSQSATPPIDPLTGNPFPGNIIPSDRLSPGGLALLNLYPDPTVTGTALNWVDSVPTQIDWNQINARLDWSVNQRNQVLFRYTEDHWENPAPNAGETNGLWGDDPFPTVDSAWDQPGQSLVAQLNSVIGQSVVNTVTFSMSGNDISIDRGSGDAINSEINANIPTFFPSDQKSGGADRSHPVYWGGATGRDLWNISPWENNLDIVSLKNDYEQVFGDHWVKAGVLYSENEKSENIGGGNAFESPHFWGGVGLAGWGGGTSGNRIADILIRDMWHGYDENAFQPSPVLEWEDIEVYVGDSWKVNDNLTVDLGVRYSKYEQPVAQDDNIVSFDPNLFDPALGNSSCNGIAQVPGTNPCAAAGLEGGGQGVSRSFVEDDNNNFAPRFGLAWDVHGTGRSVLRAGFGQFFQRERVNIQLDFGGQPPFTANTSGARPLDSLNGNLGQGFGTPNRGIDPNNETPYNFQYNVTWEQQLFQDSTLEISYVGNRGRHLVRKGDINQVPTADLNGNGRSDRLDFLLGGGDGDGSVRPFFTGGGNRILFWRNDGESEYDGLQAQFSSRFGRGSQFQASYTFSSFKANDSLTSSSAGEENIQITDFDNPDLDWGYAGGHRDHIFNASLVYNLPTFEGQGGFKEHFLGDWAIGSVVQYASGTPITVYAIDIPGLAGGGFAGTGYDDNNRPIQVGSCGGSGQQVIDPNAFTISGLRLGDTSQMADRGSCEGPDFFQVDLSFYKNIDLGNRLTAQFRIEIFNLFNEDNFIADSVENNIRPQNVTFDGGTPANSTIITGGDTPSNFGLASAV
ncbi:MAG: TonB-dependent receptor, partial [Acidobacteriota bacterium]